MQPIKREDGFEPAEAPLSKMVKCPYLNPDICKSYSTTDSKPKQIKQLGVGYYSGFAAQHPWPINYQS